MYWCVPSFEISETLDLERDSEPKLGGAQHGHARAYIGDLQVG